MKLTKYDIAMNFTKEDWTDCYFKLIDVGHSTVWGIVMSRTNDTPIVPNQIFDIGDEWHPYAGKWTRIREYINDL